MNSDLKKNLLLSLAAVLLFFTVFEGVLRLVYVSPPSELYAPDKELERKLAPDYHTVVRKPDFAMDVRTNGLGLRNPEIGPKRPGTRRVLVVGDSYAFGFGVQQAEAFPARLEALLKAEGKDAEVINAGVFGWGPDQEMIWLEREGLKLRPDVVVIAFYVGNDVLDSADKRFFELADGKLKRVKPLLSDEEMKALEFKSWLRRNVYVYAFLSEKVRTLLAAAESGAGEPVDEREMFKATDSPDVARGWGVAEAAVAEMARASKAAGAEPLLMVIPSRLQYVREKCGPGEKCLPMDGEALDWGKPGRRLRAFAEARGLKLLDLLPVFEAREDRDALNLPLDGHWNAAGHGVAAEALGARLEVDGLV